MFGTMGIGAAFINAAGRGGKKIENLIRFQESVADPEIYRLSCSGTITVESTKNGESVTATYTDLNNAAVSIQADANTDITIKGNVTSVSPRNPGPGTGKDITKFYAQGDSITDLSLGSQTQMESFDIKKCPAITSLSIGNTGITELDLSKNVALTQLDCSSCAVLTELDLSKNVALTQLTCSSCAVLTKLDLSKNVALTQLTCNFCTGLTELDLSKNVALTQLACSSCTNLTKLILDNCDALSSLTATSDAAITILSLKNCDSLQYMTTNGMTGVTEIYYAANNSMGATGVASIITNATSATGTLYTDSEAAYYSTLETAATAKGWTIEAMPV